MTAPESRKHRTIKHGYELAVVAVFAVVLAVLWILSLAGVRAGIATRAWEAGDLQRAHLFATLATRQRPELADMWLLQARCEESWKSPCEAGLSYTRAALAAAGQTTQMFSRGSGRGTAAAAGLEKASPTAASGDLRDAALRGALASAAECGSASALATVFEALTTGIPSAPERRGGIWPGMPSIAFNRPTPEMLAALLPPEPELKMRWIEFLWRRRNTAAALDAAQRLWSEPRDHGAFELWMIGQVLLASGNSLDAIRAFEQALGADPEWVPAAVALLELGAESSPDETWQSQPVALESARVEESVVEHGPGSLTLATNGMVSFDVDLPASVRRAFLVFAVRGTPANGAFPEVELLVDGVGRATFEATPQASPVVVEISLDRGGRATVSFAFTNDWVDASGDRNVFFEGATLYLHE